MLPSPLSAAARCSPPWRRFQPCRRSSPFLRRPKRRRGDPLPSWNDTETRRAIVAFVDRVTKPGSPDFVPEAERVATFDNDGTLWAEQPMYFQFLFALDRVEDSRAAAIRNGRTRSRSRRC